MNTSDKKRIEEMLRQRAADALNRATDALQRPKTTFPAKLKFRLDAAAENMKPSVASIERMEAAVEAADQIGFSINWTKPRIRHDYEWQSAPKQESHPALIAYHQARIDLTNAVRNARDAAIIALWSNDEFNIQVYFEQIDASTG